MTTSSDTPAPPFPTGPENDSLELHMSMSVDGFVSDGRGRVNPAAQWDDEMHEFYLATFREAGGVVYGRGIYEAKAGRRRKDRVDLDAPVSRFLGQEPWFERPEPRYDDGANAHEPHERSDPI